MSLPEAIFLINLCDYRTALGGYSIRAAWNEVDPVDDIAVGDRRSCQIPILSYVLICLMRSSGDGADRRLRQLLLQRQLYSLRGLAVWDRT
jgi:hypothetical protein